MFLWYFVVPELLPADWGRWVKRDMPYPQFLTAVTCLGLYTASRVAEQVRSGIEAIPRGQRNAGLAMGLHAAAGLSLRADPGRLSHHHPAADQRLPGRVQELARWR